MKYVVIFGPPGAGKGTQAGAIVRKFNLCHVSTGELLRAEISAGTELGRRAEKLIDAGDFVPDEVVEGMLESKFRAAEGVEGFLLDGFPRTISQAEDLDRLLAKSGDEVNCVISLMIPDAVIAGRIAHRASIEGRADDADPATIANRIKTYHAKTEPLTEYYKACGKYREVDGTASIEEVGERISAVLETV